MVAMNWNKILENADGYVVLFKRGDDVQSRLAGNYKVIFEKIFGPEPDKWPPEKKGD